MWTRPRRWLHSSKLDTTTLLTILYIGTIPIFTTLYHSNDRDCPAQRRLILTGTPIQNNLDELYAIVDFVAPEALGSISQFRKMYSHPIQRSTAKTATMQDISCGAKASTALQGILCGLMIRRTQSEVGGGVLPGRVNVTIYCSLTEAQKKEYMVIGDQICQ